MNTQSRIGRWSVIIGIVIVLNLFFNYTLSLVYKQPDYSTYCPPEPFVAQPLDQKTADLQNQKFADCQKVWEQVNGAYNRNVFVVLVLLGAISVLIGNFVGSNEVITNGLSLAGVLSFVIASTRYWGSANDLVRVVILAIALALLFWIAYKKFNDRVNERVRS